MEAIVLENITGEVNLQSIAQELRLGEAGEDYDRLKVMVTEAQTIAKPKALFKVAYIDERGDDYVVIEGIRFDSKILAVDLEGVHRIYPFVATCGAELQEWSAGFIDIVENFWADHIKEEYLRSALKLLCENIQTSFKLKKIAVMNPGSLQDWPLTEQKNTSCWRKNTLKSKDLIQTRLIYSKWRVSRNEFQRKSYCCFKSSTTG